MIEIDDQTLRSINSLTINVNQDFLSIVEWLKRLKEQMERKSCRQKDIDCYWTQGKAQVLEEILKIMESADETLAERRKISTPNSGIVI